jgi:hypothetical protein
MDGHEGVLLKEWTSGRQAEKTAPRKLPARHQRIAGRTVIYNYGDFVSDVGRPANFRSHSFRSTGGIIRMKKFAALLTAGLLALALGSAAFAAETSSMGSSGEHMMMSGKQVTLTGNLVDISCYVGSGAHGASHAACAKACLLKGQPFGIETSDGNIVTIFGNGPGMSYADKIAPFVEQKVTVTGTEFTGHGVTGIRIDTIAAAK